MSSKISALLTFTLLLTILFVAFISYQQILWDKSKDTIVWLQEGYEKDDFYVTFWGYVDEACDDLRYWLVIYFMQIFFHRAQTGYYFAALGFSQSLKTISKLAWHQPRPYWLMSEIKCFECSENYGNPSGHSIDAAFAPLVLLLDLFSGVEGFWLPKILFFGLVYPGYVAFVAYDRLFLGVHSIDQVVLGVQVGFVGALAMHNAMRSSIYEHLNF